MIAFGVKASEKIYSYPLVGMNSIITLNKSNNRIYIFAQDTGVVLKEQEIKPEDAQMSFEEFITMSREIYMDIINNSN